MIDRILCPVDFSSFSERALHYGAAFVSWYGARLTVLWVRAKGRAPRVGPDATGTDEHILETFASRVLGTHAAELRIAEGPVVAEINKAASGTAADLIVMGTHGASGFQRLLLGSVTEKVLRKAPCPVLTVPRLVTEAPPHEVSLGTILCAVDFSPASTRAFSYALSLATRGGGRLLLLHALEWFAEEEETADDSRAGFPSSEEDARAQLDELIPDEARSRCTMEMIVGYGDPTHEVMRVAGEQHADLIVLGVQGRGALDLTLFGSTAQHVLRAAACPVLTVGPAPR